MNDERKEGGRERRMNEFRKVRRKEQKEEGREGRMTE